MRAGKEKFSIEERRTPLRGRKKIKHNFLRPGKYLAFSKNTSTTPINSRLNVVLPPPTPFELDRNGLSALPRVPVTRALSSYKSFFRHASFLKDRRRAASSLLEIGHLFFSSPAFLHFLILLLLLISANVYPNPGAVSPCLVCAGNVT